MRGNLRHSGCIQPLHAQPQHTLFFRPLGNDLGTCHTQIYKEWASSNHAYSAISPMFHKFEQRINELSSGTIGSFCVRCHQQVGTQRGEPREVHQLALAWAGTPPGKKARFDAA